MSCGVGCRRGSDPALLWLWHRPVATSLIRPLAWEPPYAAGAAQEMAKRQKNKNKKQQKKKNKEIISSIFYDHNGIKLEINHRKRNEKKLTTWRQNNLLLKKQ